MGQNRDAKHLGRMHSTSRLTALQQLDMIEWQRKRPIDRMFRQLNDRTSVLPLATSYRIVKVNRPTNVPANDPKWMGRDWKYKEVRTMKRVSSGSVPDSLTIKNDTTDFVIRNHAKASLRSRGELL